MTIVQYFYIFPRKNNGKYRVQHSDIRHRHAITNLQPVYGATNDMKKFVRLLLIEFSIAFEYTDDNTISVRKKENITVFSRLLIHVIGSGNFNITINNV